MTSSIFLSKILLHTAVMKQYPSLLDGIDQQALWEVEVLARTTYERVMAADSSIEPLAQAGRFAA